MTIIILAGVNTIFAISWLLHGCQQDLASSRDQMTIFRSFKKDDVSGGIIKVEIFNACGVPNIAREMTDYLRAREVDVVYYDNFLVNNKIHKISHTLIIDRKDVKKTNARRIARLIQVKNNFVIHQLSPERVVDVTILIGRDYSQLAPFQ